jgi:hypothetical protein
MFLVTVPRYLNDDIADFGGATGPDCGYYVSQLSQVQLAVAASPTGPDCGYSVSQLSQVQLAVAALSPGPDCGYSVSQLSQVQLAVAASSPGPDCGYSVSQLSQVQLAVAASPPGPDCDSLVSLQADIEELISLTRENLRSVQKQVDQRRLPTESADVSRCDEGSLTQTRTADHFDEEYGLLKVSQRCGTLC